MNCQCGRPANSRSTLCDPCIDRAAANLGALIEAHRNGCGYAFGPNLPHDELPWPIQWETDPAVAACVHPAWESVLLQAGPGREFVDEVVRCRGCHAPRCGHRNDPDPCMRIRHHRGRHIALSGEAWPLGASQ